MEDVNKWEPALGAVLLKEGWTTMRPTVARRPLSTVAVAAVAVTGNARSVQDGTATATAGSLDELKISIALRAATESREWADHGVQAGLTTWTTAGDGPRSRLRDTDAVSDEA